jgi:hypothetical protein
MAQETAGAAGGQRLLGGLLIGAACLDLLFACHFAFVRQNPNPRLRWVVPGVLAMGALVMAGCGVAILAGVLRI